MATKPTPGGSDGTYGTELNAFLDISLASDGKVADGAVFSTSAAPTVDAGVTNKKHVDDQVATAKLIIANGATGTEVFNSTLTAANTFQDLDIGSTVTALASGGSAFLQISTPGSGFTTNNYIMKPKGFGSATFSQHFNASQVGSGAGHLVLANSKFLYTVVVVDSNGLVSHALDINTATVVIKVIGYTSA